MEYNSNCINYKVNPFETVNINGLEWMKYNLAVDDGGNGILIQDVGVVNGIDLGTQYYYNWESAIRIANSMEGWHLPNTEEWASITNVEWGSPNTEGTKLKSVSGWNNNKNGTDDFGLSVLPVGYYDGNNSSNYHGKGSDAYFWTSTTYSDNAFAVNLDTSENEKVYSRIKNSYYFSVRLVKD